VLDWSDRVYDMNINFWLTEAVKPGVISASSHANSDSRTHPKMTVAKCRTVPNNILLKVTPV